MVIEFFLPERLQGPNLVKKKKKKKKKEKKKRKSWLSLGCLIVLSSILVKGVFEKRSVKILMSLVDLLEFGSRSSN